MCGFGILAKPNFKSIYVGYWKDDKRNGLGKVFKGNIIYYAQFIADVEKVKYRNEYEAFVTNSCSEKAIIILSLNRRELIKLLL